MNRRWLISKTNPDYVAQLSRSASIHPLLARILVNRGIKTAGDIERFLNPGITGLSDPYELRGMNAAVHRIKTARALNQRVLVHGDYDVDGLTATAIMVHALKQIGMDVHYFVPNRLTHGYGFQPLSVDVAKRLGAKLIVTVDCGITSLETAAAAQREGIDVIITDHHEPLRRASAGSPPSEALSRDFLLPDVAAVVNPKASGGEAEGHVLSGSGVAFKVVQALAMDRDLPFDMDDAQALIDLTALGTVGDVVPLTGENRVIVTEGLRHLQATPRAGMRSLADVSGIRGREITSELLSFSLVPRINAAGRMGEAGEVVRFFLSDTYNETLPIAEGLDRLNAERQRIEEELYQEARDQLLTQGIDAALVPHGKGWHIGVIGIVASRIAEEFYRPTFVLSTGETSAKGSGRSIPGFDLYQGLVACRDILLTFGGHTQAAGIKLPLSNLPAFTERMTDVVRNRLGDEGFVPSVTIDAEVALSEVTAGLVQELSVLEPLGCGNPEPLLGAKGLELVDPRIVGSNHLKAKLRQGNRSIDAIGFDMGRLIADLPSTVVDAVFTPTMNEWNRAKSLQLNLRAIRPSP